MIHISHRGNINGKIVESGDWKLALELENDGYGKYLN